MKYIELTKGQRAIVDDEDYEWLNQWKWCAVQDDHRYYAIRRLGHRRIAMHRVIINASNDQFVDHKNNNGLDNRRDNLRLATSSQNQHNRRKQTSESSSIYKGVRRYRNGWEASIKLKNKEIWIGVFKTEHQAALAYDLWAHDLYGEYAKPNFKKAA